jgi:hypothetical protein
MHQTLQRYGRVAGVLTGALAALSPVECTPGNHWIGDWVGPGACLDAVKKYVLVCVGIRPRILGRPADSLVCISTEIPLFEEEQ